MRRDAGNVYGSRCNIDKEQDVVRNETPDRADFDAQEVRRRRTFPVSFQKRRPSGVRVSLRSGFDSVVFEYWRCRTPPDAPDWPVPLEVECIPKRNFQAPCEE